MTLIVDEKAYVIYIGGGVMSSGTASAMKTGERLVIAGLCVQVFFFGTFMVVAIAFDYAMRKYPTRRVQTAGNPWHKHLNTLYIASVLIMIRSLFRVIEYAMGNDGYLLTKEIFLYVFDAVLMLAVMVLFNVVHPSEVKASLAGGMVSKGLKMYAVTGQESLNDLDHELVSA